MTACACNPETRGTSSRRLCALLTAIIGVPCACECHGAPHADSRIVRRGSANRKPAGGCGRLDVTPTGDGDKGGTR